MTYKKGTEKDIENDGPIPLLKLRLQNLYYNSYESNAKNNRHNNKWKPCSWY